MFTLLTLAAAMAATFIGYTQSRTFVRSRLRFVDAVRNGAAPVVAGVAAGALALPVVGLLPLVGAGTAVLFGFGVGSGVKAGVRDLGREQHRYLR